MPESTSQSASVARHTPVHVPAEQTLPALHVLPHVPQFWESIFVLVQTPPQSVVPLPQLGAHVPAEHTSPVGQALPHLPQLASSVIGSTQTDPHWRLPAPQLEAHAPAEQTSTLVHTL